MRRAEMDALIDRQMAAFAANDPAGVVSVYTDDVVHRNVGPDGVGGVGLRLSEGWVEPLIARGRSAPARAARVCAETAMAEILGRDDFYAEDFYTCHFHAVRTESFVALRSYYGEDVAVVEYQWTGSVPRHFQVVPEGHGRRVTVPWLMVWQFRDGLISRHDMWIDCVGLLAQLMTDEPLEVERAGPAPVRRVVAPQPGAEIDAVVDEHLAAFVAGDADAVAATCAENVGFETVGLHRVGRLRGYEAVRAHHADLLARVVTESMTPVRRFRGEDFCVLEHEWSGTWSGGFLAVDDVRDARFRTPVVRLIEVRDGLICRERVWIDAVGVLFQLAYQTHPDQAQPAHTTQLIRDWVATASIGQGAIELACERLRDDFDSSVNIV